MKNKEAIEVLALARLGKSTEGKLYDSLAHAIKCVELMPELIDWCNRLHWIICNDHCKSNKTKCNECWMQQPIGLIKKAEEMIK